MVVSRYCVALGLYTYVVKMFLTWGGLNDFPFGASSDISGLQGQGPNDPSLPPRV